MLRRTALAAAIGCALALAGLASAGAAEGYATFYRRGVWTASGERFDPRAMTCALRSRAFGRHIRVTVLSTGRSAVCRHNDYGPAAWTGNLIDVSERMAEVLGFNQRGRVRVRIDVE